MSRPKVAWQVDSLGHTATTPDLLSLYGYETVVLGEVPLQEKLAGSGNMQFLWKGQNEVGIFTQVAPKFDLEGSICSDIAKKDECGETFIQEIITPYLKTAEKGQTDLFHFPVLFGGKYSF